MQTALHRPDALVRAARWRAGLSQTQLASAAGTSQPAISMYEQGRRAPDLAARRTDIGDIRALAERLDLQRAAEVLELYAQHMPDFELPERSRLAIEELFDND